MNGRYVKVNVSAHVWGELQVDFLEAVNALQFYGLTHLNHKESVFDLMLSGKRADCIEQLGVIIDACQDAINLLRNKQLESETLGAQPDSSKIDDALEAQQAAHEMAQTDDDEVPF